MWFENKMASSLELPPSPISITDFFFPQALTRADGSRLLLKTGSKEDNRMPNPLCSFGK